MALVEDVIFNRFDYFKKIGLWNLISQEKRNMQMEGK